MEEKIFGFVVVGKNSERDPIVKVGNDRKKVLERAMMFFERDGGAIYEVEDFEFCDNDFSSICFVETKDGKPLKIFHNNCDDPGEGFWLCSYQEI